MKTFRVVASQEEAKQVLEMVSNNAYDYKVERVTEALTFQAMNLVTLTEIDTGKVKIYALPLSLS
jgi:hypothetical protein